MMTTLPSSDQTARQFAVGQPDPGAGVVAARPALDLTLQGVGRAPHAPLGFVEELQRLGESLALPLPLLSQMFQANQELQASDAPQTLAHSHEAFGAETSLPATQLPVMPADMGLASSTGLIRVALTIPASASTTIGESSLNTAIARGIASSSPFAGTAVPSDTVAASASASAQPARATVAPIDMTSTQGALSPEAAAVRERSTNHGMALPTADLAMPSISVLYSNAAAPQSTSDQASGTANRVPQALVDALGERIEWQLKTGSERAVIRLDPPMQGQLEITIRRDAGAIQVHLSATHGDVVKQLQSISDTLRQELTGRQSGDVVVVVSHNTATGRDGEGRGRQSGQSPKQNEPGRALAEAENALPGVGFSLSKPL